MTSFCRCGLQRLFEQKLLTSGTVYKDQ